MNIFAKHNASRLNERPLRFETQLCQRFEDASSNCLHPAPIILALVLLLLLLLLFKPIRLLRIYRSLYIFPIPPFTFVITRRIICRCFFFIAFFLCVFFFFWSYS